MNHASDEVGFVCSPPPFPLGWAAFRDRLPQRSCLYCLADVLTCLLLCSSPLLLICLLIRLHCLPALQVMTLAEDIAAKHHHAHHAHGEDGAAAPAAGMYRAVGTAASSAADVMLQASGSTEELLPQGSAVAFTSNMRL